MIELSFSAIEASLAEWGVTLSPAQRAQAERYARTASEYNRATNITADGEPDVILRRHLADGWAAVPALRGLLRDSAPMILDLGSGGGFIGAALKIAWPEARVTLVEPVERKFRFLSRMAAELALPDLRVIKKNADEARRLLPPQEAVVERALAELPQALAWSIPLIREGGFFIAYQSDPPDAEALKNSLAKTGARLVKSVPYRLPQEKRSRCLAVFERIAPVKGGT